MKNGAIHLRVNIRNSFTILWGAIGESRVFTLYHNEIYLMKGSGVWYIDKALDGGFREGSTYEICGEPWTFIKDLLHRVITHVAYTDKLTILYGQYFDGIDPYKIAYYARLSGIRYGDIKRNVRIIRAFKSEDYIAALDKIRRIDTTLILIDPYLHPYTTNKRRLFGEISAKIHLLSRGEKTVIIFNRLNSYGYPMGGHFHRHIPSEIVSLRKMGDYLEVKLLKSNDKPSKTFLVDLRTEDGLIQHTLLDWMVG